MHDGLSDKTLRDFFRDSLCETYVIDLNLSNTFKEKEQELYKLDPKPKTTLGYIKRNIMLDENNLTFYKNKIRVNERRIALITLIEEKGWTEHDISDQIGKTGEHYLSFIGTEQEYNEVLKKVTDGNN